MPHARFDDVALARGAPDHGPSARPRRAGDPTVEIVEDARGLDALEADWNALLERSDSSVFQSFEWQRTWWKHFGETHPRARLHVVTIRDRGGLVAVAPLYVETVRVLAGVGLRRLLFVGHRDSDYLDVLAQRGREAECVERIAAHLADRSDLFDLAVLEEISDRSPTGPLLHDAFARRGWAPERFVCERCPQTALRGTWDETVAGFGINHRREIRRRLRNIAKEHRVELEVVPPGAQVEPSMSEFIEMHQERWARDGYWGAFADPRVAAFHREVAQRLSRRGWLFLAFLRVDGERRAANYAFAFRHVLASYLTGTREAGNLARHSPGRVLHAKSMEWAVAQRRTQYDFMRGAERYKYDFDAVDVANRTVIAYPRRRALAAATHRVHLIRSTVERRIAREAHALRVAARPGWLSSSVLDHVARSARRGLRDLRRVVLRRDRYEVRDG
jgi:CelD/BcsL family acetyltransferase involved in cellulose biosynthesis